MDPIVAQLNMWLAVGTIAAQGAIVALLALWWYERRRGIITNIGALVRSTALPAIAVLAFLASLTTLMYSEMFGYMPCGLCWLQRVFLYPLVFIAGLALYRRHARIIADYVIALAIPGAVVALYHHWVQIGGAELVACPTAGGDCAQRYIFEFGYVTFPLMAAALFGLIIVLALFMRRAPAELS